MIYVGWLKLVSLAAFDIGKCDPQKDYTGHPFFGFPHWWRYIHTGQKDGLGHCLPVIQFPNGLLSIGLAITSMLLYLAGLVAVFSVIVAGIQYMTAGGNAEKAASARKRIYNSLIGLAIVFVAAPTVAFLGNRLG